MNTSLRLASAVCPDCGAAASGKFCSNCGAELGVGSGVLGLVGSARQTVPGIYLTLLRSPVKGTVALAEDVSFRGHFGFLLAGLALFAALFVPIVLSSPQFQNGPSTAAFQTWLSILSQVGIYVGTIITFAFAFGLFRLFAREPRTPRAYFKLFCVALGFMQPIYGIFEWLARAAAQTAALQPILGQQWFGLTPYGLASLVMTLVIYVYAIAIHRRFWRMPLWKAAPLYVIASVAAFFAGYWVMFYVGFYSTRWLVAAGLLQVRP